MAKNKLIIISTRLPVAVQKINGKLEFKTNMGGGLATGVSTVSKTRDSVWVGWPGIASEELTNGDKAEIVKELKKYDCHPVFLSKEQVENFYSGYCNATIWPLFHYFTNMVVYEDHFWDSYREVNQLFATEIRKVTSDNSQFWVHDYQLMLLPELLRKKNPKATIGFFLHTPFPSYEIFRLLPQKEEIIAGILGANLVGFHTYDYVQHFLNSASRTIGAENKLGAITHNSRIIQVDAFPIGIDYKKFAKNPKKRSVKKLVKNIDIFDKHSKVILSVDRTDYSKGIPARLDSFDLFLEQNPDYHGKVVMVVLAVPSREGVEAYQELRETIEQKVSRINGRYSNVDWSPITYLHQALPFDDLTGLYNMADIMIVTPLRDGMNLVAKEYVATHHKSDGVLILSEMAGVASELPESLKVNPNNYQAVANAIKQAIEMPVKEQKQRMLEMQKRISTYDIHRWAEDYITELHKSSEKSADHPKLMSPKDLKNVQSDYKKAESRLILLDYDGTLKSFVASPKKSLAYPSSRVRRIIRNMTSDSKNKVMIVSGRPKHTLESFFEDKGLGLVAEHGGWIFDAGTWIKSSVSAKKWKKLAIPIAEKYMSRTPGSVVEEKDFSIVWHYRNVAPGLAYVRREELKMELQNQLSDTDIGIFEGEKLIEIKPQKIHKGAIISEILSRGEYDFIMAIGDDYTDEDMFRALPNRANTIHVGDKETNAKFQLRNVKEVVSLLESLKS